ncbi:Spc19-domain-containing protein [Schizophyllum commune]|nr:hypothetical protein K523DRAFT_244432 [Schizophyllum commune Tattone D]
MSRLSRANLRARDSIFAGSQDHHRVDVVQRCPASITECVANLEDSCEELHAAQEYLRQGTEDMPRMQKVLASTRVFHLIDEGTVKRYKKDVADELEPALNELLERAERALSDLLRSVTVLQAKVEEAQSKPPVAASAGQKLEARRLQVLKKQRERLEQELHNLESEESRTVRKRLP